jgi:beta-lactamase class A/flagellar hook assembly protein FlgD
MCHGGVPCAMVSGVRMAGWWRAFLASVAAGALAVTGISGAAVASEPLPVEVVEGVEAPADQSVSASAAGGIDLQATAPDLFPYADGDRDTVTFTTTVLDSRPEALPVDGTVKITAGTTVVKSWNLTGAAEDAFTWDGTSDGGGVVAEGAYTVTAAGATADGAAFSDSVSVTVGRTTLQSVSVTRDGGVAPAKDGYRDAVSFTVAGSSSTGQPIPVTGTVKVVSQGKTVKTWSLTTSAPTVFTWDGRTDGAIVAGTATVTVSAKGPEGVTRTASDAATVSPKSLVTVSGVVRDGGTVSVKLDDPGWGGTPTLASVRWILDGRDIAGANKSTLVVTKAMVGHKLSVRVAATVLGVKRIGTSEPFSVYLGKTSEESLESKVRSLISTLPGDYTVKVRELDNGRRKVDIGGRNDREPASSIKIFIAYAVYKRIDQGTLTYGSKVSSGLTVQQCLRAMIEPSDNYCATELRNKVGMTYLNKLIDDGGYTDTHFWYTGGKTKLTSATDLADLITRVAAGTILSKDSTARFLKLLKTQVWREGIPPGLPDDVVQASKPGSLWTSGGMVETDVAFVWGGKTRYAIAVMGYNGATIPSITKISRLVYTHLQGGFSDAFVYDKQQMVSTGSVQLRSGAGSGSALVATYPSGTKIEVIDSIRNWYYVRVAGKTGWMLNSALTLRNPIL